MAIIILYQWILAHLTHFIIDGYTGWEPPELKWKSVLSQDAYIPYDLEKFPLQIQIVPPLRNGDYGTIQFLEPQQSTWILRTVLEFIFYFYENRGFHLSGRAGNCWNWLSFGYLHCPSWNSTRTWYLMIKKQEGDFTIECNGIFQISVKDLDDACTASTFEEINIAWIRIYGFSKAFYGPHVRGKNKNT